MKNVFVSLLVGLTLFSCSKSDNKNEATSNNETSSKKSSVEATTSDQLYIDIHYLGAGNVTAEAVADAHKKDLEVQGQYGVNFIE